MHQRIVVYTRHADLQRTHPGSRRAGLGAMYELYCDFHVLMLFRRGLGFGSAQPNAAPVPKADLGVTGSGYAVFRGGKGTHLFDEVKTISEEVVGEGEDVSCFWCWGIHDLNSLFLLDNLGWVVGDQCMREVD